MAEITIYQKPTCSTCREAVRLVRESGQPFTAVNYYEQPFTKSRLKDLLKKPACHRAMCCARKKISTSR